MDEFMYDLMKMMDSNKVRGEVQVQRELHCNCSWFSRSQNKLQFFPRQQESLEDLQRSFMETFGADLASYYESEETTAKKRERDGASNAKATKRNRSSRC